MATEYFSPKLTTKRFLLPHLSVDESSRCGYARRNRITLISLSPISTTTFDDASRTHTLALSALFHSSTTPFKVDDFLKLGQSDATCRR